MRKWLVCGTLVLVLPAIALAEGNNDDSEPKAVSGISIVGNDEAPKSLYIVPWKNSEIGVETSLTSNLLNDSMKPVDKEVFMRELDFYEISKAN